jgi:MFS transporter, putative metabolite:H+ symporter
MGLPFAATGPGFEYGWRIMYLIGGLLALVGVLLRFQLPESARWLIARGRLDAGIHGYRHNGAPRFGQDLPASVERPAVVRVVDSEMMPYSAILGDRFLHGGWVHRNGLS